MKENYLGEQDASLYLLKIRAEGTSYTKHLVIPNTDFRRGNQQGLRRLSNRTHTSWGGGGFQGGLGWLIGVFVCLICFFPFHPSPCSLTVQQRNFPIFKTFQGGWNILTLNKSPFSEIRGRYLENYYKVSLLLLYCNTFKSYFWFFSTKCLKLNLGCIFVLSVLYSVSFAKLQPYQNIKFLLSRTRPGKSYIKLYSKREKRLWKISTSLR